MSKITKGMRIEAKRIGCKPSELGSGNLDNAKIIDKAIQEAATFAMRVERARIIDAVQIRGTNTKPGTPEEMALYDVILDIEGPLSGAPTKGAVK
jgi:acyl-CoA synthetase (NDP forming)